MRTAFFLGTLLWAPLALAQATLGALLDAGAKPLSAAQFKDELVQRIIVGPTPTGGTMEVMYVQNGQIQGSGTQATVSSTVLPLQPIEGQWTIGDSDRICTTLRISAGGASA